MNSTNIFSKISTQRGVFEKGVLFLGHPVYQSKLLLSTIQYCIPPVLLIRKICNFNRPYNNDINQLHMDKEIMK